MRRELETLEVPDGKKVSMLEWMRTPVTGVRDRARRGAGRVGGAGRWGRSGGLMGVAPVKLAELAPYGMTAKAPKIKALEAIRRSATLLATVRHLEGASVDDALLLFDVLMATRLLSRAGRAAGSRSCRRCRGSGRPRPAGGGVGGRAGHPADEDGRTAREGPHGDRGGRPGRAGGVPGAAGGRAGDGRELVPAAKRTTMIWSGGRS